jgi:hypothetical protein
MFPVRYELNVYVMFGKESVFKGLVIIILHIHVEFIPYFYHSTIYLIQTDIPFLCLRNGSSPCQ